MTIKTLQNKIYKALQKIEGVTITDSRDAGFEDLQKGQIVVAGKDADNIFILTIEK